MNKKAGKREESERRKSRKLKLNKETVKDLDAKDPSLAKGGGWASIMWGCLSQDHAGTCVPCNSVSCIGGQGCYK